MEAFAVPFHFTTSFLMTVAAAAGVWMTVARPRYAPTGRATRPIFLAGWVCLALGETIHGSLLAPNELDLGASAMRSGAYALLVTALIWSRSTKEKTGIVSANQFAATGPQTAFMPIFLSVVSAWYAFRSSLTGGRRLALSMALIGASEILFWLGGAPADGSTGIIWYLAHSVRLAAAGAIGFWLWEALRTAIRIRFVAAFVALMLLIIVGISSGLTQVFTSNVREEALQEARLRGESQRALASSAEQVMASNAKIVAELDEVRSLVSARSPSLATVANALQRPEGLLGLSRVDFLAFLDPSGAILARSAINREGGENLDPRDDISLAGSGVVRSALEQVQAGSIDVIGASKLAVIGAHPVIAPRGSEPPGSPPQLAGAVALGRILDTNYLLGLPGVDPENDEEGLSLITRDDVIATTLFSPFGLIQENSSQIQRVVFEEARLLAVESVIGDIPYFSAYVPLQRRDGVAVGALVVSQRSSVLEQTQRDVGRTLFLAALLAGTAAVALAYFSGGRITRPIRDLTVAAERVREGDLEVRVRPESEDEVGILGAAFDQMTESLKELTDDLRDTAGQLETILQSIADGVVAVDTEGRVIAFNREAERILGMPSKEASGRPVDEVLRLTNEQGENVEVRISTLEAGTARGTVSSDGTSELHVAVTSAPITSDEGELLGAVAVIRDLTREIEVEKMKTHFLSNISHELRTPLTPLKGYTDVLRRRQVPRKQMIVFLDSMRDSVRRLERIVNMLVDFSAMEAGRLVPRRRELNLEQIVKKLVDEWSELSPKHKFERKGLSKLPKVSADEKLLPAAIDELIDNAVKFSPRGGPVTISAEVHNVANGSGTVHLSVADRGIGISKEDLVLIFEDFQQLDPSETREFGGLGLGLAYVRRIAEAHDGTLEVTSRPGKGSKFTLVLPGAVVVTSRPASGRSSRKTPRTPIKRK